MFNKLQPRIIATITSITLSMAALSGCSLSWPNTADVDSSSSQEGQITSLGLEPDLGYDRPTISAHIEIDQVGYLPESKKYAIFRGQNLKDSFQVINADNEEVVFSGDIKEKTVAGTNESYFYGDFSEINQVGTYYVQTDVIGYSYPFEIKDKIYQNEIGDALKKFYLNRCGVSLTSAYAGAENARNACHVEPVKLKTDATIEMDVSGGWHSDSAGDRDVITGCGAIEAMLLAYEYNTAVFTDDTNIPESGDGIPDILNEIKFETDWLLKMQDQTTGAVYRAVSVVDQGKGVENPCHVEEIDMKSTLEFASALGYFSYLYQVYDTNYATTCLQAADRAMKYASRFSDTVDPDEYFKAATMLYRATGYGNYRQIILNYCVDKESYRISDNTVFTGVVSYLATKQKTDSGICKVMMSSLKKYAEQTSADRKDALFLMGEETKPVEHAILLSEIARLTVANYIISSNEYENLMERYLHYFLGCNPDNTCFIGQYGSINISDTDPARDILRQPELNAYLILLLSGVCSE